MSTTEQGLVPRTDDTFAKRLKTIRVAYDLTQLEAATKADVHDKTWATWENGALPQDMATVARKISTAFNIPVTWVLYGGDTLSDVDTRRYSELVPA